MRGRGMRRFVVMTAQRSCERRVCALRTVANRGATSPQAQINPPASARQVRHRRKLNSAIDISGTEVSIVVIPGRVLRVPRNDRMQATDREMVTQAWPHPARCMVQG